MMDLLLVSAIVRLAVGAGRARHVLLPDLGSILVLFVTDSIYAWMVLHGGYDNSTGLLEGGWGLFYLLLGAGALNRSMRYLEEPGTEREPLHPRRRLLLLAARLARVAFGAGDPGAPRRISAGGGRGHRQPARSPSSSWC